MSTESTPAADRRLLTSGSLAIAYLLVLAAIVAAVLLPPIRGPVLRQIERAFAIAEEGWIARVEEGEALLGEGRYEEAAAFFADLDERFPARHNIHALDKERERVLQGLGQANEALGRKGRALDAHRRAVAFDPRNVENHYALASAAMRLGERDEAERHLTLLLEIHPSHTAAVADRIALQFEGGDYAAVRRSFETYVEAFRVAELFIRVGDHLDMVELPVDGESHAIRFALPALATGRVVAVHASQQVVVDEIAWLGRPVSGRGGRERGIAGLQGDSQWALPADTPAEIVVNATAPIPIGGAALASVETAYRNLLATDVFEDIARRVFVIEEAP